MTATLKHTAGCHLAKLNRRHAERVSVRYRAEATLLTGRFKERFQVSHVKTVLQPYGFYKNRV